MINSSSVILSNTHIHHVAHLNSDNVPVGTTIHYPHITNQDLHGFITESKLKALFFTSICECSISVFVYSNTSTLMGAHDTPDISSTTSDPPSPPHSLPSSLPPTRPGRPRPPLSAKSSPLPLVSLSNSISASCTEDIHQNTLPPLYPTLVSPSPLLIPQPIASVDQASSSPPFPAPLSSKLLLPSDFTTSSSVPQPLTHVDRLIGSSSVWQPKGFSEEQIMTIMEQTTAGVCPKRNINNKEPFFVYYVLITKPSLGERQYLIEKWFQKPLLIAHYLTMWDFKD